MLRVSIALVVQLVMHSLSLADTTGDYSDVKQGFMQRVREAERDVLAREIAERGSRADHRRGEKSFGISCRLCRVCVLGG